jgi:peptidoglycan/LPS O-acetylase OafA/YrhL
MVGATVLYFLNHATIPRKQLMASWFFLQNYFHEDKVYLILSHTWTLAVEEHFYLLLPLLLTLLIGLFSGRDPFRVIPPLFLFIASSCLALRYFTLGPYPYAWMTHMRLDGLFAGVALGYLYHFRVALFRKLTRHYALILALLLCTPALFFNQPERIVQTLGLTCLYIGFSFLVAWSVVRTPKTFLGRAIAKGAAKIGFYSYSIYLWHTLICDAFLYHANLSFIKFWIYIATTIAGGWAMAHLVELPYQALRERLFPSPYGVSQAQFPSRESHALPSASATPA